MTVVDTFGRTTVLRHYSEIDGADGGWRMFAHSAPAGTEPGSLLYAAPTVVGDSQRRSRRERSPPAR